MNLLACEEGREYFIKNINIDDDELKSHLFSLGCYPGEPIALIKRHAKNLVVVIKDARYSIDRSLAEAIEI